MNSDKLRTNIALFVITNFAEPSRKSDIALKPSAVLALCGVLGALCRRFEPVTQISYSCKSQLITNSRKYLLYAKLTQKIYGLNIPYTIKAGIPATKDKSNPNSTDMNVPISSLLLFTKSHLCKG